MELADKRQLEAFWEDEEKIPTQERPAKSLWEAPIHTTQDVTDKDVNPPHYNYGEVECIDAIESAQAGLNGFEGFCTGNAIKYLWRWKHKGGVTDLKKAAWYIDRLVKFVERKDAD